MTRPPCLGTLAPHALRRVGTGGSHCARRSLVAAAFALTLAIGASANAAGCGPSDIIGIGSRGHLGDDGALTLELTATASPIDPLTVTVLVFVDGVLSAGSGALDLPCDETVVVTTPPSPVVHAVHWTLMHRPAVSPLFEGLEPELVLGRYAAGLPPGAWPVFVDAPVLRTRGGIPFAPATSTPVRAVEVGPDLWVEDRVVLVDDDLNARDDRLARLPVGAPAPFRVHYTPGEHGAGRLLVTCLLDERQVEAFDGEPFRVVEVPTHHLLELDGVVTLPRPGWHRLHCLLLSDEPGSEPPTLPRPLDALFLWGDG